MDSGVAGGYEGNQQQNSGSAQTGKKQNWLDKGIESMGKKAGMNVGDAQADRAGDFINKEGQQYSGHNIPGLQ
ncbi:hypothetical protein WOLCODRAFT_83725 [Wolfiporia cocos MD-104 SS10]|uniref:Uncharacterized protein n=1 Tax=Wolfiporia cocos (strain MD-104) TaxID=742152 RepID=A0A2H3J4C3_WOLCO|nr:hypothetical protein WOLCODRAFT_83725 [Wolfiporia cocos MD-104 SS10]